jgi:chromosomal replication initiation ATPase DnaA
MSGKDALRKRIMWMVCESFGCTVEQLRSQARTREVYDARCAYSYLTRHHAGDTYTRIGMELNKDHSAAVLQVERMVQLIFIKDPAAKRMKKIEQELLTKQLI